MPSGATAREARHTPCIEPDDAVAVPARFTAFNLLLNWKRSMATIRVTVVVENTAYGAGLLAEHGLAFWIEIGSRRVLFDTGQGGTLVHNAYRLSVPLRETEAVILSHGHYDHTGGLAEALKARPPIPVYAHPAALEPKFMLDAGRQVRDIGIPFPSKRAVREHAERLVQTQEPTAVVPGLFVTGPVPRATDFETTGGDFFLDPECRKPDPLEDDQSVYFDSAAGTVVLLGCAHSGVVNTLYHIRRLTNGRPIHAVLGGMHLVGAPGERVDRTMEELQKLDIQRLGPAHCTGIAAIAALWNALPGRCVSCHTGATFEFEAAADTPEAKMVRT